MKPDAPYEPPEATSPREGPDVAWSGRAANRPGRRRDPNFGRRRQLRNRLLRALLLLTLIFGVGGLTALFLQGRGERAAAEPEPVVEAGVEAAADEPEAVIETAQLSAEQFESTLEREGVEVFRIRGAQTSSDDQGNVSLNQVEVDYPQGEDHYSLRADGATYNERTSATHLQGSVALEGTNGLVVDTDWLELAERGTVLTAADDSRLGFGGVTATGDGLRMNFREEIARMGGGVRLVGADEPGLGAETDPGQTVALTAETLEYRWRAGVVRALGGATMRVGNLALAARSLTLHEGEDGALARLEARGEIEVNAPVGTAQPAASGVGAPTVESTLLLRGNALRVEFDELMSPSRVDLSGPAWGGSAVLRIDHADGSLHRIRARFLEFTFLDGLIAGFSSRGRVELHQRPPGRERPMREATSVTASGRFDPDGALVEMTLGGNVRLIDRSEAATVRAEADKSTIDPIEQRASFHGQPARLVHAEGRLEGRTILYDQARGCSEAKGEVRLTLRDASGETDASPLPFGDGSSDAGPSVITAGETLLCEAGESLFRGDVELRRGPDSLAADQMRIAENRSRLVANGDVRTVWHSRPVTDSAGEAGSGSAPERWSIAAASMHYDETGGELRYSGGAAAVLGDQNLECDELTVETAPAGSDRATGERASPGESGTQTLFCLGNARLHGLEHGRSVEANRAIYAFAERMIRLSGDVVFRGGADEWRGPGLIYWIDQGRYETRPFGSAATGAGEP